METGVKRLYPTKKPYVVENVDSGIVKNFITTFTSATNVSHVIINHNLGLPNVLAVTKTSVRPVAISSIIIHSQKNTLIIRGDASVRNVH